MSISLKPPVSSTDHLQGTNEATIEIVEFGDFQCPDCGAAYPVIKNIQQIFGKQIKFVYRNLPLTDIHRYAMMAALAAEAAGHQHKYWEMHDLIFEHQRELDENLLYQLSEQLGLDAEKFKHDLKSHAFEQKINQDISSAEDSEVPGTPTFFVNGKMFDGGAEDLLAVLRESTD